MSRERFISAPFKSCNIVQWPYLHWYVRNLFFRLSPALQCHYAARNSRQFVVSAFMMRFIPIVVDECVINSNLKVMKITRVKIDAINYVCTSSITRDEVLLIMIINC